MEKTAVVVNGKHKLLSHEGQADLDAKLATLRAGGYEVELKGESNTAEALIKHGGQGLTFGFGDEIYGGIKSVFGGEDYEVARDRYRDRLDELQESNPIASTVGSIGGSMLLPGGAAVGAGRALGATSKLGQLGRLAAIGAAEGGVAAVGESEKEGMDALTDAPGGAVLGAGFATGAGTLLPALGNFGRRAGNFLAETEDQKVGRAIGDLVTPEVVDEYGRMGKNAMLLDASDELLGAAAAAKDRSGAASQLIDERIKARRAGAQQRVEDIVTDAADIDTNPARQRERLEKIRRNRDRMADMEYGEIAGSMVNRTPELEQLLNTPLAQAAIKRNRRVWESMVDKDTGLPYPSRIGKDPLADFGDQIPLSFLDMIKKSMDKDVKAISKNLTANGRGAEAGALTGLAKGIRGQADLSVPKYKKARETFKKHSELVDSGEAGAKTVTPSRERLLEAENYDRSGPGQDFLFREGVVAGIIEDVRAAAGHNPDYARKAFTDTEEGLRARRLKLAAIDNDSFKRASTRLLDESRFKESESFLLAPSGSRTQARRAAVEKLEGNQSMSSALIEGVSNPVTAAATAMQNVLGDKITQRTALRLAEVLSDPNLTADELQRYLQMSGFDEQVGDTIVRLTNDPAFIAILGGMSSQVGSAAGWEANP